MTFKLPFFAGVLLTACAVTAAPNLVISEPDLDRLELTYHWMATLPMLDGDLVEEAYLVDDTLYVLSEEHVAYSVTADSGLLRWTYPLTEAEYKVAPPTHLVRADGRGPVMFSTTTGLIILDRYSGDLVQRFMPEFATGSPPIGIENSVFMGSSDGRVYSLALKVPGQDEPLKRWEVYTDGPVTAKPILYDLQNLIFASQGGVLFACGAADKAYRWSFRTGAPIVADPAADESGAYVASTDRSLYKVKIGTGALIWRVRFPASLLDGPKITAHTVYQYCAGYGLAALDAEQGHEVWHHDHGKSFVAHYRDRDIVFTDHKTLDLVDHVAGKVLASVEVPDAHVVIPNTVDDGVYVVSRDGRVLCAHMADVPYLRRQQIQAARQRLTLPPIDRRGTSGATEAGKSTKPQDDPASDPLRSPHDR